LEIEHFSGEQQHLHFGEDENPFSYYNEVNKRESISSEEEIPDMSNHIGEMHQESKHNNPSNGEKNRFEYKPVEIG
jgi:hypothetical protein